MRFPIIRGAIPAGCVLLAGALIIGGCRRPGGDAPDVVLDCRVTPSPPRVGAVRAMISLARREGGAPVTGAHVSVEGDMAHPGMVPVFGTGQEVRPGDYEAPLTLTMGGDWVLTVTARLPDGRRVRRELKLPGVKGS